MRIHFRILKVIPVISGLLLFPAFPLSAQEIATSRADGPIQIDNKPGEYRTFFTKLSWVF